MPSAWDSNAALMDDAVDEELGDDISYSIAGAPAVTLKGFVLDENASLNLDGIDEMADSRKRVKIRKSLVANPGGTDRIVHARLGAGTFKPAGKLPDTQGRYWIFDVQRV